MRKSILALALLAAPLLVNPAFSEEFEIKMLNKGENGAMVFEPDFVKASLGDVIRFVPVDKGHNVATIKGMLPDEAEKFNSKFGKEFVLTADVEGVYGVKCTPHFGMGMVALIVIGEPVNLEAATSVKQKGKAKERFDAAFAKLGEGAVSTTN